MAAKLSVDKLRRALELLEIADETLWDLDLPESFLDGLVDEIEARIEGDPDDAIASIVLQPIMDRLEALLKKEEGSLEPLRNPRKRR